MRLQSTKKKVQAKIPSRKRYVRERIHSMHVYTSLESSPSLLHTKKNKAELDMGNLYFPSSYFPSQFLAREGQYVHPCVVIVGPDVYYDH